MTPRRTPHYHNPAMQFISQTSIDKAEEAEASERQPTKPQGPTEEATPQTPPPATNKTAAKYMETKSKRTQILLQPTTLQRLRATAKDQNISVNSLINTLLIEALDNRHTAQEIRTAEETEWQTPY